MGESRLRGGPTVTTSDPGLQQRLVGETSFGKYTLIAKIGHGGMAEVFLAAIRGPAGFTKLCVLKRLHPHLEEEESLVGMFLDEARLAARLNHPNVVQTYEVGDVQGLHFLTMEYLEGQSLSRVLRHARRLNQPIPLAVGVRLFIDMLDGLHYAHTLRDFDGTPLSVVHRDISPGNIFVTYEGQVKVLDFGIAKAGTQLMETRAGQVKGKFAYIAPEQASPDVKADHRADLWSLGVVMWEAFAGKRLFKGESEVVTLHNALNSTILSLDSQVEIPDELARIVDRSLQRDPERRYQSAQQMKEDLEAFMHDSGLRCSRGDVGTFVTGLFERERDEQRRVLSAYMRGESPGHVMTPVPVGQQTPSASYSGVKPSLSLSMQQALNGLESDRRKAGWVLVALVILLAVGLGAALAFMDDDEPVADNVTLPSLTSIETIPIGDGTQTETQPESATDTETATATETETETEVQTETETETEPETEAAQTQDTASNSNNSAQARARAARERERRRRAREAARRRAEAAAAAMMTMQPTMPPDTAMQESGTLNLDTTPWSTVSLNGRNLGTTPLVRVSLPAGTHVLTLTNPERGLRTTYRVRIRPGETTSRRIGLE